MHTAEQWAAWIKDAKTLFGQLYGTKPGVFENQQARWRGLVQRHQAQYGGPMALFSTSGRVEIGGNHTDHNAGRVLAAGVSLDTIAAVTPREDGLIRLTSKGYAQEFLIETANTAMRPDEKGTTTAILRGIADRFKQLGYQVGGFDATVESNVMGGSGLSSSAAFEVLIATILDHLYNGGVIDGTNRAMISQYAENEYFGKPSGLMDQTACALGGLITIDFADPQKPIVQSVAYDFFKTGMQLVVVDTGGGHAGLNAEYAGITEDMALVASFFGKRYLREVNKQDFYTALPELHERMHERAILRAWHFFGDNDRVAQQVDALRRGDFEAFLAMVTQSGESSVKWLQNCYVAGQVQQSIMLALAVSEQLLAGQGAWRVHGGGFAGTILCFVPDSLLDSYVQEMEAIFGEGKCTVLSIRPIGSIRFGC